MRSKLFISLSTIALVGMSVATYAAMTRYTEGGTEIPKGDCLEMLCQYGCVENDDGDGLCCSAGELGDKCYGGLCCQEGLVCSSDTDEGTCQKVENPCEEDCDPNCQKCDTTEGKCVAIDEEKAVNECGKCQGGKVVEDSSKLDDCHECKGGNEWQIVEKETAKDRICGTQCCEAGYTCDLATGQCVEKDGCSGVILYQKTSKQGQTEEKSYCCEGVVTTVANTDSKQRGYLWGENTPQYGCCPNDRAYEQTCCKTTQKALSTGCCDTNKIFVEETEEKCCPTNAKQLPVYDQSCHVECGCYDQLNSGLTCDSSTSKCVCPKDHGWSSTLNKCIPYCTKDMGVFLLVDRSGSTFDKGSDHKCDRTDEPCYKINNLLKDLDVLDRNFALYNDANEGCGYNVAMSMLPFGKHSSSAYNLWNDVYYEPKCAGSGTYFDEALKHIKNNYCKRNNPIVIMIITDGKIQKRRDDMAGYMNDMIDRCDARIVYIGPDGSKLKKTMNNKVSNFDSLDFDDSVQSWIRSTNTAINGTCIPTTSSLRNPSTSDTSWFCNVLNNADEGDSFMRLTEEQCSVCPNTKFRDHNSQSKWGDAKVCCGKNNNKGDCKF